MKRYSMFVLTLALSVCALAGCGRRETFVNPGDYLGGGFGGMGPGRR